jgi:hypothetical protein
MSSLRTAFLEGIMISVIGMLLINNFNWLNTELTSDVYNIVEKTSEIKHSHNLLHNPNIIESNCIITLPLDLYVDRHTIGVVINNIFKYHMDGYHYDIVIKNSHIISNTPIGSVIWRLSGIHFRKVHQSEAMYEFLMDFPHVTSFTQSFKLHVSKQVNMEKSECFKTWSQNINLAMWFTYESFKGKHLRYTTPKHIQNTGSNKNTYNNYLITGYSDKSFYFIYEMVKIPEIKVMNIKTERGYNSRVLKFVDGGDFNWGDANLEFTHYLEQVELPVHVDSDPPPHNPGSSVIFIPCMFNAVKIMRDEEKM